MRKRIIMEKETNLIYQDIKNSKRIVIKVGTSTLTYDTGKMNIKRIDTLARTLSDLHNSGKDIVLVSSGAVGAAMGKLGISERPSETNIKQALAAVGQCELMYLYDKLFSEYHNTVAQVLLTKDDISVPNRMNNTKSTFNTLLEMGIIPIVNENDTVSTEELEIGDNDNLSALVAELVGADLLILFSDIDGLYDSDPHTNPDAKIIPLVKNVDDVKSLAGGAGSKRGTGGMITKLEAAKRATSAGINMIIANGNNIQALYDVFDGEELGTLFVSKN